MIPINTTTISIFRPPSGQDPYDAAPNTKEAAGVRAVIGSPSGTDRAIGGDQQIISARLTADPCDLRHYDEVRDDVTGETYAVVWSRKRNGFGLDHVAAGLRQVTGAANG